jgi:hypothetical protein
MSKIKIVCGNCRLVFKEHHSKIREGLSVGCPGCAKQITFDNNTTDLNIKRALRDARRHRLNASAAY